jgi:hypothetical protein
MHLSSRNIASSASGMLTGLETAFAYRTSWFQSSGKIARRFSRFAALDSASHQPHDQEGGGRLLAHK